MKKNIRMRIIGAGVAVLGIVVWTAAGYFSEDSAVIPALLTSTESNVADSIATPDNLVQLNTAQMIERTKPIEQVKAIDFSEPLPAATIDFPLTTPRAEFLAKARSLENTEIGGQLRADDQSNLVLNPDVRDFFDYFLSALGEVTLDEAVLEIRGYAKAHLPVEAAQQTTQVLEEYLLFKAKAVEQLELSDDQIEIQTPVHYYETLRSRVAQLKTLRRQIMAPQTVAAFFSEEERLADHTLKSLEGGAEGGVRPDY